MKQARRPVRSGGPASTPPGGPYWLWGRHAVAAMLANPARRVRRLVATRNAAADLGREAELVEPRELDRLLGDAVHQGVAALVDPLPDLDTADAIERGGLVLVLDQVTDPQNVGALFRTAAAFGAGAVIQQDRKSPPVTGALAKAAAGAVETVADVRVVNIARALEELRGAGYQVVGLAGEGAADVESVFADRPIAVVMGAEGKGLRPLVAETCDALARIDIDPAMESLNVSAAAAVALSAARRASRRHAAIGLCRRFLARMEARDLDAARALTAPGFAMTFPGGQRFTALEDLVAWSAGRYSRIAKSYDHADATDAPGGVLVTLQGRLAGERPDGGPFAGVRFIDWFRVEGGLIRDQRVWNDLDAGPSDQP